MNRVSPKLETINTISENLDQLQTDYNNNDYNNANKKVQFDPATVSFQVNYDGANESSSSHRHHSHHLRNTFYHHYHRHSRRYSGKSMGRSWTSDLAERGGISIPLWQEHLHPNKSQNIFLLLARQMTCAQWTKCLFLLFCFIEFFVQLFYLYSFYRKNYTHSSIAYRLPKQIEFPAVTLCLPVIIPFNDRCMQQLNSHSRTVISQLDNSPTRLQSTKSDKDGAGIDDDEDEDEENDEEEEDDGEGSDNEENNNDEDSQNRKEMDKDNNQLLSECDQKDAGYLFNYSISEFGHNCKIRYSARSSLVNCASTRQSSSLIESYFQNRRCFTYNYYHHHHSQQQHSGGKYHHRRELPSITEFQDSYISLVIRSNHAMISSNNPNGAGGGSSDDRDTESKSGSNTAPNAQLPELYVHHQTSQIPIDSFHQPLTLPLNRRFTIGYHYVKQFHHDSNFYRCQPYNHSYDPSQQSGTNHEFNVRQECLDRCYLSEMGRICNDDCSPISYRLPIRRHLTIINPRTRTTRQTRLCTGPNQNEQKCSDSDIESILDSCEQICPEDCTTIETKLTVDHSPLNDETETHIRLQRKMEPDIVIYQLPAMNCLRLVADIGGIFVFWLLVAFLCCKMIDLIQYGWDLWELHYLGL